jgi:hypothetical protein
MLSQLISFIMLNWEPWIDLSISIQMISTMEIQVFLNADSNLMCGIVICRGKADSQSVYS